MKLLLHLCCGPCATGTLAWLREEMPAAELTGFFYNPNIHPVEEYQRRRQAMAQVGQALELPVVWAGEEQGVFEYLQQVAFRAGGRCRACYAMRLAQAARQAVAANCDAFSTTLLISPYQDLADIHLIGRALGKHFGPDFLFHDLRPYYPLSRSRARELGLYQQKYCGCLFSELDREQARARRTAEKAGQPTPDFPQRGLCLLGSELRPFTLAGLDPEATAQLLASLTAG